MHSTLNRLPPRILVVATLAGIAATLSAHAHLGADVRDKAAHSHPLVQVMQAEATVGDRALVIDDAAATDGKAVRAGAGTRFELTTGPLPQGLYAFYVVGRMPRELFPENADGPDVLFRFTVENPAGTGEPIVYEGIHAIFNDSWQYVQELYFHTAGAARAYRASIEIEPASPGALVIDRFELRNALGGVEFGAFKRARNLYTDEEVALLRAEGPGATEQRALRGLPEAPLAPEARRQRDADLARLVPDLNSLSRPDTQQRYREFGETFQQRLGGVHRKSDAEIFLLSGAPTLARDLAFLLALSAYRWPALNHRLWHIANGQHNTVQRPGSFKRQWGKLHIYRGWAGPMVRGMLRSYDILFPTIVDNQELADALGAYIPWVRAPRDVVALLDSYLVQQSWRDYQRKQGESPIELVAAVLGPCELSERLLATYSRFREDLVSNHSRDGLTYIGSTYYAAAHSDRPFDTANLLARYVAAGGDRAWDIADPRKYPRLLAIFDSLLGLSVSGGLRNNTGDLGNPDDPGNPIYRSTVANPDRFYLTGWRWTRDPRYAWLMANAVGVPKETLDTERAEIAAQAAETPDPLLHQTSRVHPGFGIAVMESGQDVPDRRFKRSVVIRTGIASGHAQSDTLNLALYAFGARMAPDLGGRAAGQYGRPSTHLTRLHNAVEVDRRPVGGTAINATAYGWVDAFKPFEGAQFMTASARAESHPDVSLYRRSTALVDISPGQYAADATAILPSAYVFDVFRVRGGTTHTYCFHGAVSDEFTTNVPLEAASETAAAYLARHRPGTLVEGVSADPLEAVWRLRRAEETFTVGEETIALPSVEKKFMGEHFSPDAPPKYTRLTLFGHGEQTLMSGHAWCHQARRYSWPMLYVQRAADAAVGSVYPAIIEASAGDSAIASKRRLMVTPFEAGAEAAVAIEVQTVELPQQPTHVDLLFASERPQTLYTVDGGAQIAAHFAYLSQDARGVRLLHVTGGRELRHNGVEVHAETAAWQARIAQVDYETRTLTLDRAIPPALLAGQRVRLGNDQHRTDVEIVEARLDNGRTVLHWHLDAATWRGRVRDVDAAAGTVVPEDEPPLFNYHPQYYNGMTAVSGAGRSWKVRIERGERWMFLGWPVADARQRLSWADIPDADGDGRRILRMVVSAQAGKTWARDDDGNTRTYQPGEHMLDVEVTRLSDDGRQFWYRQHPMPFLDSLGVPHRGWPYHEQILRNEDGSREWCSVLPEDDVVIHLEGGPVDAAAFVDAAGQNTLTFYDFGVGDDLELATHVFVRRLDDGSVEVRANTPCNLRLPLDGGVKAIAVTAAMLEAGAGRVTVR